MDKTRLDKPAIDWKGTLTFLLITFVLTYGIEGALIASGMSPLVRGFGQYTVLFVMWVPALATVITVKWVTREGFAITNIRFGGWRPYLRVALIIPVCYLVIYALTWLLGLGQPDWNLLYFRNLFLSAGMEAPPLPPLIPFWIGLYLVTLLVAPFINSIFAFGEELGWRGYLLPKLLPLGKPRAYLLMGIIWGLWHLPLLLVGYMYPGYPFLGTLLFLLLTTGLGIFINELTLRQRSSILAGWAHGIFNSQRLGIWALLFPNFAPLLGGFSGLLGIAVWWLLGWWESRRPPEAI